VTLWLAVRFPQLMIDALQPSVAEDVALVVREAHRLVAANRAAKDAGIRLGMRPATALALCDRVQLRDRQPEQEQHWLIRQARPLSRFTPMICLQDDCLLLELGPSLRLFHGHRPLLAEISAALPVASLWQLAWGHTPLAAQLLTHQPLAASEGCLMPDDQGLPDLSASRAHFLALLGQQPVDLLPLPARLASLLQGTGLRRLSDLFALPQAALQRRFGPTFMRWLQQLRGDHPDLRQPIPLSPRFSASLAFDEPVSHSAQLQQPMQMLLQDMSVWMVRQQLQVRVIRWRFFPLHGEPEVLLIRRAERDHHADSWMDLCWRHLEQYRLTAPVLKLVLDTGRPLPMAAGADSLFAALERPAAAPLLEKLANLPGLRLYRPGFHDSHLPEQSERAENPLTAPLRHHQVPAAPLQDTPLWLLDTPIPLACRHGVPHWRGAAVELLPSHRRLNEPWWQQGQSRHYHIGRHPLGVYCWLFCSPDEQGQWFLHGFF
jgi:protein ImuB